MEGVLFMTEIKLFIAATIDGFIARDDGSLDWLDSLPNPNKIDHGYAEFYKDIGTVVIGRKTYEEVLGFGVEWPYANCKTYVVTSKDNYRTQTENTEVINSISAQNIEVIKTASAKDIWVVGGGEIITGFLNYNLIDEVILCIIPVILGKGIPLFPNNPRETLFELKKSEQFETGAVALHYKKNRVEINC